MRSFSSFTPHYAEDVTISISQLLAEGEESQSALSVLQALTVPLAPTGPDPNPALKPDSNPTLNPDSNPTFYPDSSPLRATRAHPSHNPNPNPNPNPNLSPKPNPTAQPSPHRTAGATPRRVGEHHRAGRPRGEPRRQLLHPTGGHVAPGGCCWHRGTPRLRRSCSAECWGAALPRPTLEPSRRAPHERRAATRQPCRRAARRRRHPRGAGERSYYEQRSYYE